MPEVLFTDFCNRNNSLSFRTYQEYHISIESSLQGESRRAKGEGIGEIFTESVWDKVPPCLSHGKWVVLCGFVYTCIEAVVVDSFVRGKLRVFDF